MSVGIFLIEFALIALYLVISPSITLYDELL